MDRVDFLQHAFTPVTKWSVRVEDAREIPAVLNRAFALATAGRPGPVHVEIPLSTLQSDPFDVPAARFPRRQSTPHPPPGSMMPWSGSRGAGRIAIVVGKNAWWPSVSAQVVRLAERLGAPVAHSWDGHAAMPTVHPLSIGVYRGASGSHPAAWQEVSDADLVLGIGVRPGTETAAQLAEQVGNRLLLIDAADEPDGALAVAASSVAALAEAVGALAEECGPRPERRGHPRAMRAGTGTATARYRHRIGTATGIAARGISASRSMPWRGA